MTTRRDFLRGAVALAGGLVLARASALATVARLGTPSDYLLDPALAESPDFAALLRGYYANLRDDLFPVLTPLFSQMPAPRPAPRTLYDPPRPRTPPLQWGGSTLVLDFPPAEQCRRLAKS